MLAARTRGRIAPTPLNVADDIPVSNLSTEKLEPAFRWRDGLFVQEFDSVRVLAGGSDVDRKLLMAETLAA